MSLLMMNIIVLIFEILYYSLFMKFARKDGKIWKYFITFLLTTIIAAIFDSSKIYSYLLFIISSIMILKYLVKIKSNLYDMLVIVVMLFTKIIIEFINVMIFYNIFQLPIIVVTAIFTIFKLLFILKAKNKLNKIYNIFLNKWNNNDFYVRYIFSVLMIIYVIISTFVIIFSWNGGEYICGGLENFFGEQKENN